MYAGARRLMVDRLVFPIKWQCWQNRTSNRLLCAGLTLQSCRKLFFTPPPTTAACQNAINVSWIKTCCCVQITVLLLRRFRASAPKSTLKFSTQVPEEVVRMPPAPDWMASRDASMYRWKVCTNLSETKRGGAVRTRSFKNQQGLAETVA